VFKYGSPALQSVSVYLLANSALDILTYTAQQRCRISEPFCIGLSTAIFKITLYF